MATGIWAGGTECWTAMRGYRWEPWLAASQIHKIRDDFTYHLQANAAADSKNDLIAYPLSGRSRRRERGNQSTPDGNHDCSKNADRYPVSHSLYCESISIADCKLPTG